MFHCGICRSKNPGACRRLIKPGDLGTHDVPVCPECLGEMNGGASLSKLLARHGTTLTKAVHAPASAEQVTVAAGPPPAPPAVAQRVLLGRTRATLPKVGEVNTYNGSKGRTS